MMTTEEIRKAYIEHAIALFPEAWSSSPVSVQRQLIEINASTFAHMIEALRKEEKIHNETAIALTYLKHAGIQPTMTADKVLNLTRGYADNDAENT